MILYEWNIVLYLTQTLILTSLLPLPTIPRCPNVLIVPVPFYLYGVNFYFDRVLSTYSSSVTTSQCLSWLLLYLLYWVWHQDKSPSMCSPRFKWMNTSCLSITFSKFFMYSFSEIVCITSTTKERMLFYIKYILLHEWSNFDSLV